MKENVREEIRSALEQLLASASVVGMEANDKLEIVGNISVQLPLTLEGARATISNLRNLAIENGVDFSEFESYSTRIEEAVRNQAKDNLTIKPSENGISEYNPEEMDKENKLDLEM